MSTTAKTVQWNTELTIALLAVLGIVCHIGFRVAGYLPNISVIPLYLVLLLGGTPLVLDLVKKMLRGIFSSDLLAGISIITAVLLGEYLAATLVVLMLSGGVALEHYAVKKASSVLEALAQRMPGIAHILRNNTITDIPIGEIAPNDTVVILPHEISPVDGIVLDGHGAMDESYLTGEPFQMQKTPGSDVLSGAINGESSLTIRATKMAVDSRYAQIMSVVKAAEQKRPNLRRVGDQLGAYYTPLALVIAAAAGIISSDPLRFLAVLVIATPCPLLIGIPVAIIGSISLCARRGIIIRDPTVLEQVTQCRTMIMDKTGTLTYGRPALTDQFHYNNFLPNEALSLVGSLEQYSRHPLALAISEAARALGNPLPVATEISEKPGQGLRGKVNGREIQVTSRSKLIGEGRSVEASVLTPGTGLECVVLIDGVLAAQYRFRDAPRIESKPFVHHLSGKHNINRVLIVSGDREEEVRYLAQLVGISEVYGGKSPEEKVSIVQSETDKARTIYVGDGINDAPALMIASVGVAFGRANNVTSEAAGAVIMESSISKVDEFFHIGHRMRTIALQSAVGGICLSVLGMGAAAFGILTPVAGAVAQEIIDLLAVTNALRAALPPKHLTDY